MTFEFKTKLNQGSFDELSIYELAQPLIFYSAFFERSGDRYWSSA